MKATYFTLLLFQPRSLLTVDWRSLGSKSDDNIAVGKALPIAMPLLLSRCTLTPGHSQAIMTASGMCWHISQHHAESSHGLHWYPTWVKPSVRAGKAPHIQQNIS